MQVKPSGSSLVDLIVLSNKNLVVASAEGEVIEVNNEGHVNNYIEKFHK